MNQYLINQYQLHPSMEPEDVIKMTYQAVFGAEHLLADKERARQYLHQEFESTDAEDIPLYEEISDTYSRVNIASWKYHHRNEEEYFSLFVSSLPDMKKTAEDFNRLAKENIQTMEKLWSKEKNDELVSLFREEENHLSPIHHSQNYREKENPHYRIVMTEMIPNK